MLTNFLFLYVWSIVLATLGLTILFYPFDSSERLLALAGSIVAVNVLGAVVGGLIYIRIKDKSVWLQPVSTRTGTSVANVVVAIWLSVVALLVFLMLRARGVGTVTLVLALFLSVTLGCAWPLRRRFSRASLLPYGIASLFALFAVIAVMAGFGL